LRPGGTAHSRDEDAAPASSTGTVIHPERRTAPLLIREDLAAAALAWSDDL